MIKDDKPEKKSFSFQKLTPSRAINFSGDEDFVDKEISKNPYGFPFTLSPALPDVDICKWIRSHTDMLRAKLNIHGALLFRNFDLPSVESFNEVIKAFNAEAIKYMQRSSPRHEIKHNIYTSTDHPADQVINLHNEHSYAFEWPLHIAFFGLIPSVEGGETPIADTRLVLKCLSDQVKSKFLNKGVLYVRNLGTGMGMSWQEAFQSSDKNVVEKYCEKYGIKKNWIDNDRLKLEFIRPAIRLHPETGEQIWFNHAFFFNILSLEESLRDMMKRHIDEDSYPFLTYYGDGSEIEFETIEEIRHAFDRIKVNHTWRKGDVLLLDNMLMAHGRNSYKGDRKILVAMMNLQRDNGPVAVIE